VTELRFNIPLLFVLGFVSSASAKPFEYGASSKSCALTRQSRSYLDQVRSKENKDAVIERMSGLNRQTGRTCDHCDPSEEKEFSRLLFDPRCFAESTRRFAPDNGRYSECSSDKKRPSKKPCITEYYALMLSHSFSLMRKCTIKNDAFAQGLYWILTTESGLSPNIENQSQAAGIGQLVGDQIEHLGSLKTLRNEIQESAVQSSKNSPGCKRIHEVISHKRAFQSNSCNRTRIPPNPLLGMLWAYMTLKNNASSIERFFSRSCDDKDAIGNKKNCEALRSIHATIAAQSYNAGLGHVLGGYRYALKNCSAQSGDATECLTQQFKTFTKTQYSKRPNRAKEILSYGAHILDRKKELQNAAKSEGIQCGTL
jgi:hypothetical protein